MFLGVLVVGTLLVAALALSGARPRMVGIAFVIVTLVAYVLGVSDPAFRRAEVFSLLTRALYAL